MASPKSSADHIAGRPKSVPEGEPLIRSLESAWAPAWLLIHSAIDDWRNRLAPGSEAEALLADLNNEIDFLERACRAYLNRWSNDLIAETSRAAERWIQLAWAEREARAGTKKAPHPPSNGGNGRDHVSEVLG
ncbi:MAG TPA: hypothetical protein VGX00_08530 [Thermoplasmata archaeon]|nr:hypothetical protein [Thermoplasmata archaeon]